jgi:hypothetical protein
LLSRPLCCCCALTIGRFTRLAISLSLRFLLSILTSHCIALIALSNILGTQLGVIVESVILVALLAITQHLIRGFNLLEFFFRGLLRLRRGIGRLAIRMKSGRGAPVSTANIALWRMTSDTEVPVEVGLGVLSQRIFQHLVHDESFAASL